MAEKVRLPKLSATMTEAIIVGWLKQEGEPIAKGEPLVQVETDKAVLEVESPVGGVVKQILQSKGTRVSIDTVLALVE
ncbi:MAG: biotin attachment protein [Chloroflexi bacterium]|jgi:pyruvate/2-oxoglutarate dehydrogenase complex dihydrolipoamide acyltransferase (E2) component|nr:biotin attachment protein [Chloroflexota bacterium]